MKLDVPLVFVGMSSIAKHPATPRVTSRGLPSSGSCHKIRQRMTATNRGAAYVFFGNAPTTFSWLELATRTFRLLVAALFGRVTRGVAESTRNQHGLTTQTRWS